MSAPYWHRVASRPRTRLLALAVLAPAIALAGCGGGAAPASPTSAPAPSIDPAPYLSIETGTLPIVLSAPHGGTMTVPGVPTRQTGTTVLDTNTYQLAAAIQGAIASRTGRRAALVAALASRSYVDFNRAPADAYESASLVPLYQAYHSALQQAVSAARLQSADGALLVDIHGQSSDVTVVFRGTRGGQTATLTTLYASPGGFLTRLQAVGIDVSPRDSPGAEHPDYNGGYIVATYGTGTPGGINAVQLEFGMNYRQSSVVSTTAGRVADAIVEHLRTFAPGTI
jgi:N-formylglutamate amidohydrolase